MGDEYCIAVIDRKVVREVHNLSFSELIKRYGIEPTIFDTWLLPQDIIHVISEKNSDMNMYKIEKFYYIGAPLYKNEEVKNTLSKSCSFVVGEEGLIELILFMQEMIVLNLKDLFVEGNRELDKKKASQKQYEYLRNLLDDWQQVLPIHLGEDTEEIAVDSKNEYHIFEVVRKLKTIDFTEKTIIFYKSRGTY